MHPAIRCPICPYPGGQGTVRAVHKNGGMTPSPQDFHDRAVAAADAEGRLPLPEQLSSFEQSRLPFGVMLMPREHLDLGDLAGHGDNRL